MARREFSKAVKVQVVKRAMQANGVVYCEKCGQQAKKYEIDHEIPDAMGGEPTAANAVLMCVECHREKTNIDVTNIAKAKRREALHLGVRKKPSFVSRGFAKFTKPPKEPLKLPPRKPMFRDKD